MRTTTNTFSSLETQQQARYRVGKRTPEQTAQLLESIAFYINMNSSIQVEISLEEALRRRYHIRLLNMGILMLQGLMKVVEESTHLWINDVEWWTFEQMSTERTYKVPPDVYEKYQRSISTNLPFEWGVWVKQHARPPKEVLLPQKVIHVVRKRIIYRPPSYTDYLPDSYYTDPVLLGLMHCGEEDGIPLAIPCVFGAWKE